MEDTSSKDPPNLADCHGCGVRINHTNPKDRLQPMNSMWRIVLLCKKCTKRVNSSELCPYCFTAVVNEADCFKCSDCERNIHKGCVKQYDLRLGFSVCVDCWVPEAFGSSSIKAKKWNLRNKSPNLNESDLYVDEVERKVAAAAKASQNALMKAVVAKNAVELAKGILSVVRCRKVVGGGETEVVDDAELAVLLHRVINSSPMISRYAWFGSSVRRDDASVTCYSRRRAGKDTTTLGVSLMCYSRRRVKGCFKKSGSLNAPLLCYSRYACLGSSVRRVDKSATCYSRRRAGKNVSSLDVPLICYSRRHVEGWIKNSVSLNAPLLCYSRRRSCRRACLHDGECECVNGSSFQENEVGSIDMKPNRYLLKYYRIGKSKSRPSLFDKDSANLYTEGMTDTRDFGNGYECHEVCERVDDDSNRFLLKYKRISRSKPSNHPMKSTTLSDVRPCSSSE